MGFAYIIWAELELHHQKSVFGYSTAGLSTDGARYAPANNTDSIAATDTIPRAATLVNIIPGSGEGVYYGGP